ncbi:MAG TPA: hypothetical protein VL625_00815 [Patescibacteria group bacterium]|jgi:hypothetical protein|nr:hypothetical protein [Patescibacteria group bacterium]
MNDLVCPEGIGKNGPGEHRRVPLRKRLLIVVMCLSLALVSAPKPAPAGSFGNPATCPCPNCIYDIAMTIAAIIAFNAMAQATVDDMNLQFQRLRDEFMVGYFFDYHVLNSMQNMAQGLATAGMLQLGIIGGFLDASEQLQRQRLMEQLAAEAHKQYQSSTVMCTIGTMAKGLGNAYRLGQFTALTLEKRSLDRQMHDINVAATSSPSEDVKDRIRQFKQRYCDIHDNNDGLSQACNNTSAPPLTRDRDINFTRTVMQPGALDLDFSNNTITNDEQDIIALENNLFASQIMPPMQGALLMKPANQPYILDYRSVIAKRAVAENSFTNWVGLKAQDGGPGKYASRILEVFGVARSSAKVYESSIDLYNLGRSGTSYDSEMEILTKRIEQDPNFYTNLYDTPANLARKGAALRAIGLMQHMDMFKSRLRNEGILAEIVELAVDREQREVQDNMDRMRRVSGRPVQ